MDRKHLNFIGGKDIESESNVVKDETPETSGDKDNYFQNMDGSLGDQNRTKRPERKKTYNG